MEELTVDIPKSALMEVDGHQVDGQIGDGTCMGGEIATHKTEWESRSGTHRVMERRRVSSVGSNPPIVDLSDIRRDGVWCMAHPAWGMDGKLVGHLSMGYGAWAPSSHA